MELKSFKFQVLVKIVGNLKMTFTVQIFSTFLYLVLLGRVMGEGVCVVVVVFSFWEGRCEKRGQCNFGESHS